jgi:hypothetical protein
MKTIIDIRLKITEADNGGWVVDWSNYANEFPKKWSGLAVFPTRPEATRYAEGIFCGDDGNGIFRRFFGKKIW